MSTETINGITYIKVYEGLRGLRGLDSVEEGGHAADSDALGGIFAGDYYHKNNPPNKVDVGLSNVDNTSDADKPISIDTKDALDLKENSFDKNTAFNLSLGTEAATVAEGNHSHEGEYEPTITKNTGFNKSIGTGFDDVAAGDHGHTPNEVGLNNVNNTSDLNKPISDATALALETGLASKLEVGDNISELVNDAEYIKKDDLPSGGLIYRGLWDADQNIPDLVSKVPEAGEFYIVSVPGTTSLGGVSNWAIQDWAVYSDGEGWGKIDNTANVLSVNGQTGAVVLDAKDISMEPIDNLPATDVYEAISALASAPAGLEWIFQTVDNYPAEEGRGYISVGGRAELPSDPSGDISIAFSDQNGDWDILPLELDPGSNSIEDAPFGEMLNLNVRGVTVELVYKGNTWRVVNTSNTGQGPTQIIQDEFDAGSVFTLSVVPPSADSLWVTVDGVLQRNQAFTLNDDVITLSEPATSYVNVRHLGVRIPISTVADQSVTSESLQNGAVTEEKLDPEIAGRINDLEDTDKVVRANAIHLEGTAGSIRFKDTNNGNTYSAIDAGTDGLSVDQLDETGSSFVKRHAYFNSDGSTDLYHNGILKSKTSAEGFDVTGRLTANNIGHYRFSSSDYSDAGLSTRTIGTSTNCMVKSTTMTFVGSDLGVVLSGYMVIDNFSQFLPQDGIIDIRVSLDQAFTNSPWTGFGSTSYGTAICKFSGGTGGYDFGQDPMLFAATPTNNELRFDSKQINARAYSVNFNQEIATTVGIYFSICISGLVLK